MREGRTEQGSVRVSLELQQRSPAPCEENLKTALFGVREALKHQVYDEFCVLFPALHRSAARHSLGQGLQG